MGRRSTGSEMVLIARRDVALAKTACELRAAQSVLLPLILGLKLTDTAKAIGRSKAWVSSTRRKFIKEGGFKVTNEKESRGGRRNSLFSEAEEAHVVTRAWIKTAELRVNAIRDMSSLPYLVLRIPLSSHLKTAIELQLGESVSRSTVYKMMSRVAKKKFKDGEVGDWEILCELLMRIHLA